MNTICRKNFNFLSRYIAGYRLLKSLANSGSIIYNVSCGKTFDATFNFSRLSSNAAWTGLEKYKLENATCTQDSVEIKWENGEECDFPYLFLRENCLCPKCFDADAKSRLFHIFNNIDFNLRAKSVNKYGNIISIEWPDGHISEFHSDWLYERKFPANRKQYLDDLPFGLTQTLWNREYISTNPPFLNYEDWVRDDEVLMKHVELLLTHGFCIVKNVPSEFKDASFLAERLGIGYFKTTHYGKEYSVISKAERSNVAFSGGDLSLHNDICYLINQADIQILYCIEQQSDDDSGKSRLADGFYIAEKLKKNNPKAFSLLSTTLFPYIDVGSDIYGEFHAYDEKPVFRLNSKGEVNAICFNTYARDSYMHAPSHEVIDLYKALHAFYEEMNNEETHWTYKLQTGDILTLHNKRMLHGRRSYDPRTMTRHLIGAYFDWDSLFMKYRVLKAKRKQKLK